MKRNHMKTILFIAFCVLIPLGLVTMGCSSQAEEPKPVVPKIDSKTGLPLDPESGMIVTTGFKTAKKICTRCHSSQNIVTSSMDREGWIEYIRKMQEEKGLERLRKRTEEVLLTYLVAYYGP